MINWIKSIHNKGYKHFHLIRTKMLSIYIRGNYCRIEIDIHLWNYTHTYQLFTNNGIFNHF